MFVCLRIQYTRKLQFLCRQIKNDYFYYWAALSGLPSYKFGFRSSVQKNGARGRQDTRSGTERRCSHKWFHTIFPCTDPSTNTYCTCPPPPPQKPRRRCEPEGSYLRYLKRFDHRSHSYKFCHCSSLSQLMMLALGNSEKCSRCIQTHTPFTVGSH